MVYRKCLFMAYRIHFFQHVNYEDPGFIFTWCNDHNVQVTFTRFFENDGIPDVENYDCLVVLGGPMGVYDEKDFPWLTFEKAAIAAALRNNIPVLGICLGAQLLASILGAPVYKNGEKEIGWYDIQFTSRERIPPCFKSRQNQQMKVFHWHGDTFDVPEKALLLASSEACKNQAFLYGDRVMGLQFHFEVTAASLEAMLINGRNELSGGKYIQNHQDILRQKERIPTVNKVMAEVMDWLTSVRRS